MEEEVKKIEEVEVLIGQATAEQIAMWKNVNDGDVFAVKAKGHVAYFKRADRNTVAMLGSLDGNPVKQAEAVLNNCFIGGSESIIKEDDKFLSAMGQIAPLLEFGTATVEKL